MHSWFGVHRLGSKYPHPIAVVPFKMPRCGLVGHVSVIVIAVSEGGAANAHLLKPIVAGRRITRNECEVTGEPTVVRDVSDLLNVADPIVNVPLEVRSRLGQVSATRRFVPREM